ncbi:DUF6907 domain-containing protein [Streptomyces sp. NPDC127084]|uniref:DUF6907 domain-containing protein n=1 Tax=Streptomyces sp. NPDC127084 TaxID=3347133 RepID=UPI00365B7418
MTGRRIVAITTADHGDVTLLEPSWCLGEHPAEGCREDVEHKCADVRLMVPTACHGPVLVLTASLVQRPFSPSDRRTLVAAELDQWHEFDAPVLDAVAAALVQHTETLRCPARRLAAPKGAGR